ncbi:hypothetical protein BY458DRAFT_513451 [Sporodiniella umbellata]|nr:hypothetical protein BY458DRAFT_513451 [Sporodiniella umbellata]
MKRAARNSETRQVKNSPTSKIPDTTFEQRMEEEKREKRREEERQEEKKKKRLEEERRREEQQKEEEKRKREEQVHRRKEEGLRDKQSVPLAEEKRNSSFFASASRFFKSNSKPSPSPSSTSISDKNEEIPSSSAEPVEANKKIQTPAVKSAEKPMTPPVVKAPVAATIEKEEEEREDTNVIEDEATRAFADEIAFKSKAIDYTLPPDLLIEGMDSLKVRTPLLPSVSTPTASVTVEVDPWSLQLEPSTSTPIVQVPTQEIEPQKRKVFADLITSWNTGQSNDPFERVEEDQFFQYVAEEKRDVAFGLIKNDDRNDIIKTHTNVHIWDEVENPWS